jgi:Domain of unknown function (DUF4296)
MRTTLLTIFLLVIFFGCSSKNKIPADILPQDKMQAVLWDMMRADQFLSNYVLVKDSSLDKRVESIKYYQRVFAIHKVDKTEFVKSYHYYRDHPALLSDIMDSLSRRSPTAPTKPVSPIISDSLPPIIKDTISKKDSTVLPMQKRRLRRGS